MIYKKVWWREAGNGLGTVCFSKPKNNFKGKWKAVFHSTQNSGNFKCNGPCRFGPTGKFGTSFEGGSLWPVRLSLSVEPKCPSPFVKIVVPITAVLYPAFKNNNQSRGCLGRVFATGMYRYIGHVKSVPKFRTGIFVEWKTPLVLFHN